MPSHNRMRVFDRDLIRGGHYGQRSCEPLLQAEHMAAPTQACDVKKALANSEPSTHGILARQQICRGQKMCAEEKRPAPRTVRVAVTDESRYSTTASCVFDLMRKARIRLFAGPLRCRR